jgi:hypothetical protein
LQSVTGVSQVSTESSTYEFNEKNLACFLAHLREKAPDLAIVVDRWGKLPDALKAGILAMVDVTER